MFTHNAAALMISPNMGTGELSVNTWENKVTSVTYLKNILVEIQK